jgi:predicted acetyltransferase
MIAPELVLPAITWRESFLEALSEYHADGMYLHRDIDAIDADFAGFLRSIHASVDPVFTPPGMVPQTHYWLVDGLAYVGRLSLRHGLNDSLRRTGGHIGYDIRPSKRRMGYGHRMLPLGLEEARKRGLTHVLLTSSEQNVVSRRIIEANGGVLQDVIEVEGEPAPICRYWITL